MDETRSSETSVLTRATLRQIPKDDIFQKTFEVHIRREHLTPYILKVVFPANSHRTLSALPRSNFPFLSVPLFNPCHVQAISSLPLPRILVRSLQNHSVANIWYLLQSCSSVSVRGYAREP
jgi:hypothetical protein